LNTKGVQLCMKISNSFDRHLSQLSGGNFFGFE
jgi:hypothetical protein